MSIAILELLAGFYVSIAGMPPLLRFLTDINPIHHGLMSYLRPLVMEAQLACTHCINGTAGPVSGAVLMEPLGFDDSLVSPTAGIVGMLAWSVVLRAVAAVGLRYNSLKLRPRTLVPQNISAPTPRPMHRLAGVRVNAGGACKFESGIGFARRE